MKNSELPVKAGSSLWNFGKSGEGAGGERGKESVLFGGGEAVQHLFEHGAGFLAAVLDLAPAVVGGDADAVENAVLLKESIAVQPGGCLPVAGTPGQYRRKAGRGGVFLILPDEGGTFVKVDLGILNGGPGGAVGTGQQHVQARVFDLAAMEERAVLWDSSSAAEWMSGLIQLQLAGTREAGSFGEKREAVYQITAPDGSTLYAGTGGFSLTEFPDAPSPLFGDNEAIVLDGDRLVLSSGFWVDLGVGFFGPYLGWLTCGFQYDPAQQSFSLSPECTLQVDTPVDPSAISLLQA